MATTYSTDRYFRSHMKRPRGRGSWAFYFDGAVVFAPGVMSLGEAKRWAMGEAKTKGVSVVEVAP